ncbi:MAG: DNA-binding protein [Thermoprotei archaeon]|nr:MAG: DNA-binding protein [Thermoprotei archaeon]
MEIDPLDEVTYRLRLAEEHLQAALKRLKSRDWAGAVEASQLTAENAAKAVIAHSMMPSWSHDPSDELLEAAESLPRSLKRAVKALAAITRRLPPEHGRTSYGLPEERLTPSALYNPEKARRAVKSAKGALNLAKRILAELGYPT